MRAEGVLSNVPTGRGMGVQLNAPTFNIEERQ